MFKEIKDFYKRYEITIWLIFFLSWLVMFIRNTYEDSKKIYPMDERNKILTEMFKDDLKKKGVKVYE